MPLTNFPQGITSFGVPVLGPNVITGRAFFVSSRHAQARDAAGNGTVDKPFATLAYAMTQVVAFRGDVIYVMPGHTESFSARVTSSTEGFSIIGLGWGELRPKLTALSTTGMLGLAADGILVQNLIFLGGIDAVNNHVQITRDGCRLYDCEFRDVTGESTSFVQVSGLADYCHLRGIRIIGAAGAGGQRAFDLRGPAIGLIVEDFHVDGNFSVGVFDLNTGALTNVTIRNGYARNRNSNDIIVVDTITGSTGSIGPNIFARLADNATNITEAFAGATFHYFDPIMVVNADNERGILWDGTQSTG